MRLLPDPAGGRAGWELSAPPKPKWDGVDH
jgi:hypothetical protein